MHLLGDKSFVQVVINQKLIAPLAMKLGQRL